MFKFLHIVLFVFFGGFVFAQADVGEVQVKSPKNSIATGVFDVNSDMVVFTDSSLFYIIEQRKQTEARDNDSIKIANISGNNDVGNSGFTKTENEQDDIGIDAKLIYYKQKFESSTSKNDEKKILPPN